MIGRFDTPGECTLVLTRACNFRCIYCFNSSGSPAPDELRTEEWLDVVEQAKDLEVARLTLSGGEPMMHPGFFDILKKVLDSDIMAYVCSNGSLINDRTAARLADMGLACIQISLDAALASMHDQIVGVAGTFSKVVNAIRCLVAAGLEVYVKTVLTPLNMGETGQLIELLTGLGVRRMLLDRFDLSNPGRGGADLFLTRRQERQIAALVETWQKKIGEDMWLSAAVKERCWSKKDDIIACGAFRSAATILPNGDVATCEKITDLQEMVAGNLRKNDLLEIWTSETTSEIVHPPRDKVPEPCKSCEHLSFCGTGCFSLSSFVSNDPYAVDPRCWLADLAGNPYRCVYF